MYNVEEQGEEVLAVGLKAGIVGGGLPLSLVVLDKQELVGFGFAGNVKEIEDANEHGAVGGGEDGRGYVDAEMLIRTIREKFEMTIDIEKLTQDIDEGGSGEIEYDENKEPLFAAAGIADEVHVHFHFELALFEEFHDEVEKLFFPPGL